MRRTMCCVLQRYPANSLIAHSKRGQRSTDKPPPYDIADPRMLGRKQSVRRAGARLPRAYRKAHIKVGKRGILDFNFGYHNVSRFSGLEDNGPNAAFNAALQACVCVAVACAPMMRRLTLWPLHSCSPLWASDAVL